MSTMTRPIALMMSVVRCGREVWPPRPRMRISMTSQAAVRGPLRTPICPAVNCGSQWRAKIAATSVSAPCLIMVGAPEGNCSSEGWKTSRKRPGSSPRADSSPRTRPTPMRIAVWASWPQAWHTPSTVERYGTSFGSWIGRASMSARTAMTRSPSPMSQVRPVPSGMSCGLSPPVARRAAT